MTAGRKRKMGERFPSGKLKPARVQTNVFWQRERDALRTMSRRPEFESPLGVLFRAERITASLYGAGIRFAADRKDADVALSLPARNCQAQDIVNAKGGSGREDGMREERRKRAIISAYEGAEQAVGLGSQELAALQNVVVYERRPDDHAQFLALVAGLEKLAKHYGVRS